MKLVKNVSDSNEIGIILSDQYPGINSKEFKGFLHDKNIPIIFTSVNSPFPNGLNERLNQILVNKIRCKINEENRKKLAWTTIAHNCTKMYNETGHTVTGFAPKYLMEGADIRVLPEELNEEKTNNLMLDRETAVENIRKSHNYNKKQFDKHRKEHEFNVGDWVYVENGYRRNRKKLDELRIVPYQILDKISTSIYKIDTGHRKSESNLFQITKLVPVPALANEEDTGDEDT